MTDKEQMIANEIRKTQQKAAQASTLLSQAAASSGEQPDECCYLHASILLLRDALEEAESLARK